MTLPLAATDYGSGPPLVILHGLFGSGRNWAGIAQRLAADRHVVTLDLRNHGASPWDPDMSYRAMAEDVLGLIAARGLGRVALLGHSMGGKVAMVAALAAPDTVERLVVADVAPAIYPPTLAAYAHAMAAVDLAPVTRRGEVDAQLAAAIPNPAERAFLLQNLALEQGVARWRLNLAAIEPAMSEISGFPRELPGAAYGGPALFIAGGASSYVRPEHEPAIRVLFPAAEIVRLPGVGHWLHAEAPEKFLAVVAPFLAP